jgi:hypothetical protein
MQEGTLHFIGHADAVNDLPAIKLDGLHLRAEGFEITIKQVRVFYIVTACEFFPANAQVDTR